MPAAPDDREIIRAVLAGQTEDFAHLVRRYHGPLLHAAEQRLGNGHLAEDAVQDTFLAAYRSLSSYKPEFAFRTWLWTILLNQCRRHYGRAVKARQPAGASPIELQEQAGESEVAGPAVQAMLSERNALLAELLEQLPEAQADAIRLRFFGSLKFREIATVMQSSLSSAKQRVRQGLLRLSELLREREMSDVFFPGDSS